MSTTPVKMKVSKMNFTFTRVYVERGRLPPVNLQNIMRDTTQSTLDVLVAFALERSSLGKSIWMPIRSLTLTRKEPLSVFCVPRGERECLRRPLTWISIWGGSTVVHTHLIKLFNGLHQTKLKNQIPGVCDNPKLHVKGVRGLVSNFGPCRFCGIKIKLSKGKDRGLALQWPPGLISWPWQHARRVTRNTWRPISVAFAY